MPLTTTTIGAYPKPASVPVMDWFAQDAMTTSWPTDRYEETLKEMGDEAEAIFAEGVREVIDDQVEAGIDIVTDGEVRRENYIHYHCRHLAGFDFSELAKKSLREGAYVADLPRIVGPRARASALPAARLAGRAILHRPAGEGDPAGAHDHHRYHRRPALWRSQGLGARSRRGSQSGDPGSGRGGLHPDTSRRAGLRPAPA